MPTKPGRRKSNLLIQYAVPRRGVPSGAFLRRWAIAPVTLRIVDAAESRRLNRIFRGKNRATNVLTFATGDVVLCHPVIRREARAQGKRLRDHYAHLVLHGCLHLRGYDHEKKRDAARMEAREIRILRRGGIRNPYTLE